MICFFLFSPSLSFSSSSPPFCSLSLSLSFPLSGGGGGRGLYHSGRNRRRGRTGKIEKSKETKEKRRKRYSFRSVGGKRGKFAKPYKTVESRKANKRNHLFPAGGGLAKKVRQSRNKQKNPKKDFWQSFLKDSGKELPKMQEKLRIFEETVFVLKKCFLLAPSPFVVSEQCACSALSLVIKFNQEKPHSYSRL